MDITSIAASGMLAGADRLAAGASNVANLETGGYSPERVDQISLGEGSGTVATTTSAPYSRSAGTATSSGVDPVAETVGQIGSLTQFRLSAKAAEAGDAMDKALLDIAT